MAKINYKIRQFEIVYVGNRLDIRVHFQKTLNQIIINAIRKLYINYILKSNIYYFIKLKI